MGALPDVVKTALYEIVVMKHIWTSFVKSDTEISRRIDDSRICKRSQISDIYEIVMTEIYDIVEPIKIGSGHIWYDYQINKL